MCDERCFDRISHEKLSSNWKSKQKRNNESSEGRAHPVTCIICGKPRRLHGHCISGTSVYPWDTNTDQRRRGRERERLLTQQSTGRYRMTTKAFHTRGKINSCLRWWWWSGVGVCPSIGCNTVCVCVWTTNIRFANETIAVFDQFHNWCNPANRYISDQDDQGEGPTTRAWAGIVKLKCFEFIQE